MDEKTTRRPRPKLLSCPPNTRVYGAIAFGGGLYRYRFARAVPGRGWGATGARPSSTVVLPSVSRVTADVTCRARVIPE